MIEPGYTRDPLEYAQPLLPFYYRRQEYRSSRRIRGPCILYITWLLLYIWCSYSPSLGLGDLHTMQCLPWPTHLYHAQFWSTLFAIMIQLTPHTTFVLVGYAAAESLFQSPFIQALKEGPVPSKCSQGLEDYTHLGKLQLRLRMFLKVLNYGIVMFLGSVLPVVWPISMLVRAVCTIMSVCGSSI